MEAEKKVKRRIQPVRRKVKQLDWIMQWLTRVCGCAICGKSLSVGYDKRNPGQSVTLHHTEGSREEDNWDDLEYVKRMVPCHKTCHRSYHLTKRHADEGKNVDREKLAAMEKMISRAVTKLSALG